MAVKQPLSNQQHINQPPHWKAEIKHESFTRHLEGLENPDCWEIHSYESPLTEQHPHYKNRHVLQTYMVESLSVLWTVWSFWPWALSDSNGYISSLVNGWLTGCTKNMLEKWRKKEDKERVETHTSQNRSEEAHKCVALLSQHPSCTVSKTSGCRGHALHTATQKTQYFWVLFLVVGFFFFFFLIPQGL